MDKLRDELLALFSLKKGKFETANRKSLDRFLERTEFQRRRQAFFEAKCSYGRKKSRVAMCKKGMRPGFAVELKTQSTKQLRQTIADFLKELGILDAPKVIKKNKKQLQSFARKHHWQAVLFLSDTSIEKPEEKKGGMLKQEDRGYHSLPERDYSDDEPEQFEFMTELRPEQKEQLEERRKGAQVKRRHRRRSVHPSLRRQQTEVGLRLREPARRGRRGPVKGSKYHKKPHIITGRDPDGSLEITEGHSSEEEVAIPMGELVDDPVERIPSESVEIIAQRPGVVIERDRSPPPLFEAEQRHRVSENPPIQRVAPPLLRTEQKEKAGVIPRRKAKTPTAVLPKVIPKITQPVKTGQDEPALPKDDKEEDKGLPKGDTEDASDEIRECYALSDDEDVCECEPDPLTSIKLTRAQRKELNRINALRKLNCAKLNLLKCTLDLKKYQTRVWEADRLNTNGDFLALFGKNPVSKLNKIKTVTDPKDRDFLKAVLANQNATMRLKKGKEHLHKRLGNQKSKLGKDYTLASMRHDQVLDEKAWSNDIFTMKALENRDKEAPLPGKITCDTFKVPKCPPPLPCPEKPKEKPFADLSQLPKVVPQKEEKGIEQPPDGPRESPVRRGDPQRAREQAIPAVPEFQAYPESRMRWAEPLVSEAEARPIIQDPQPEEDLAQLERSVREKQRELAQEVPPTTVPSVVHSDVSSKIPLGPQQQKAEADVQAIQAHQENLQRVQGLAQREAGSQAPTLEISQTSPKTYGSPTSFIKGPGPGGPPGGHSEIVRHSIALARTSTPIHSGKPGEIRKALDREPVVFGPDIHLALPEPGSPPEKRNEPLTPKGTQPIWRDVVRRVSPEKTPQRLGKHDMPLTTERLDILPRQMSPLNIGLSFEDTVLELQQAEQDFTQEFRTKLVSLRWPTPRSDLPKVPLILGSIPWITLKYTKEISLGLAMRWYDAIEPLLKQVDFIQLSEPLAAHRLTDEEINLAQRASTVLRFNESQLTVEHILHLLQVIAPRKIQKKHKRLVDALQKVQGLRARRDVQENMIAVEAEKPRKPQPSEKSAAGFSSRVGALLKKRKGRKKRKSAKPRNPRKPRKQRKKQAKMVEVQKQETVMAPKKPVEIPRSPKIKKTAGAIHKFPDFVRKRKTKKYLN